MIIMQNNSHKVVFYKETGLFDIVYKNTSFKQIDYFKNHSVKNVAVEKNSILFDLICDGVLYKACVCLKDEYVELSLSCEEKMKEIAYPNPFETQKGDLGVYPVGEGFVYPVEDMNLIYKPMRKMYGDISMGFFGVVRDNSYLLCVVENIEDTHLHTVRDNNGFLTSYVSHINEKGFLGYKRSMRFYSGDGKITKMCHTYRKYVEEKEELITFSERVKLNPNLEKLKGAADVWLWNDGGLESLYEKDAKVREITPEILSKRKNIAREMKNMGMDRVMWNDFEKSDIDTTEYIKNLGYLVGSYDIYQDVIPKNVLHLMTPVRKDRCKHIEAWPDDMISDSDGSMHKAWYLTGIDGNKYDQNSLCDMCAIKYAAKKIPEDIKENGYNARLVDTTMAAELMECYNKNHPMTRRDCMRYRKILLRFIRDMGIVCGTECAMDKGVNSFDYNEGNLSPSYYRATDAGRNMTTLYYGDDVTDRLSDYMMNIKYRAPLWELIYHDCVVSYWYWGDSQMCCPEHTHKRDLINALYGTPPLYSINVAQWNSMKNEIVNSYKRASKVAKLTCGKKMISFEYLTDDFLVQKTIFENKVSVVVNFKDEDYILSDKTVIKSFDYIILE